jgi:hypothetical protein
MGMATKKKPPAKDRRHTDESWIKSHWRPMMAWQYFVICLFDFLIAPVFFAWFSWVTKTNMTQWTPLTLQGGGLYHLSMGAIIGISSYSKSQERINTTQYTPYQNQMGGMNNGYTPQNNYQQTTQYTTTQSTQPIITKPRQTTKIVQPNGDPEL